MKKLRLDEICEIKRGKSITKKSIFPGDIPVIAGGRKPAYFHNQSNRNGKTITISSSGAYAGFVNYFDIPIFASDCFTLKPKNELGVCPRYIFYFLKSKQQYLYTLQTGAGQPHVYPKDVSMVEIPLPPLSEQQTIVSTLEEIDDLCQKQRKALELTRQMIPALFYEMFSSVEQAESLRDILIIHYGKALKKSEREAGINPVFGSNGCVGFHNKMLVGYPTIIIGRKGSVGKVILAEKGGWPIDTTYYVELIKELDLIYLYWALKLENLENLAISTSLPGLNRDTLYNQKIPLPSLELQRVFEEKVQKTMLLLDSQEQSLKKLDSLFDSQFAYF